MCSTCLFSKYSVIGLAPAGGESTYHATLYALGPLLLQRALPKLIWLLGQNDSKFICIALTTLLPSITLAYCRFHLCLWPEVWHFVTLRLELWVHLDYSLREQHCACTVQQSLCMQMLCMHFAIHCMLMMTRPALCAGIAWARAMH